MSQAMNDTLEHKEPAKIEKPKFTFKSWYKENKEKLSESRKQKYLTDPEYRAKLKEQAKKYRVSKPKQPRKKSSKMTIPMLCELAGCSPHTYRKYCQQGWIPVPKVKVLFNETHVKLLDNLASAARDTIYLRKNRDRELQPFIDALQKGWK